MFASALEISTIRKTEPSPTYQEAIVDPPASRRSATAGLFHARTVTGNEDGGRGVDRQNRKAAGKTAKARRNRNAEDGHGRFESRSPCRQHREGDAAEAREGGQTLTSKQDGWVPQRQTGRARNPGSVAPRRSDARNQLGSRQGSSAQNEAPRAAHPILVRIQSHPSCLARSRKRSRQNLRSRRHEAAVGKA